MVKQKQIGFRLPENDATLDWLEAQNNIGTSLRLVMRMVMSQTGAMDFADALADGKLNGMTQGGQSIPQTRAITSTVQNTTVAVDEVKPKQVEQKLESQKNDAIIEEPVAKQIKIPKEQPQEIKDESDEIEDLNQGLGFDPIAILQNDAKLQNQNSPFGS